MQAKSTLGIQSLNAASVSEEYYMQTATDLDFGTKWGRNKSRLKGPKEVFWYKHHNYLGFVAVADKLCNKKRFGKQCCKGIFPCSWKNISFSPFSAGQDQTKYPSPSTGEQLGLRNQTTGTQRSNRTILLLGNNRTGKKKTNPTNSRSGAKSSLHSSEHTTKL